MSRRFAPVFANFDPDTITRTDDPSWYVSLRNRYEIVTDKPIRASHFVYNPETQAVLLVGRPFAFKVLSRTYSTKDVYPVDMLDLAYAQGVIFMAEYLVDEQGSISYLNYHGQGDTDVRLSRTVST